MTTAPWVWPLNSRRSSSKVFSDCWYLLRNNQAGSWEKSVAYTAKVVTLGYHSPDRSLAGDYCLSAKLIHLVLFVYAANVGGRKNYIIMTSMLPLFLVVWCRWSFQTEDETVVGRTEWLTAYPHSLPVASVNAEERDAWHVCGHCRYLLY